MEIELVAAAMSRARSWFTRNFLLIGPLADRVQKPPPPPPQIRAGINAAWSRGGGKELSQISIVEIGISIFVKLALARVIGLELEVQTIVVGDAIVRQVQRRLARQ